MSGRGLADFSEIRFMIMWPDEETLGPRSEMTISSANGREGIHITVEDFRSLHELIEQTVTTRVRRRFIDAVADGQERRGIEGLTPTVRDAAIEIFLDLVSAYAAPEFQRCGVGASEPAARALDRARQEVSS